MVAVSPLRDTVRMSRRIPPAADVLGAIGNTPLVRLDRLLPQHHLALYAKLEFANPGGSVKDRPAALMLAAALREGRLGPDTLIVESSSGNMAIGIAQFCRVHDLRFRCVVDVRAQAHNLAILRAYGAEIDLVELPDPVSGDFLTARLNRVGAIVDAEVDVFWPNQYANPDNPRSHELGTMREIDEALDGDLDYLFVATSSTGTVGGCLDYLRSHQRTTKVVRVDAFGSVLFGGEAAPRHIAGLGAGVVPPLVANQEDGPVWRATAVDCVVGCRRLVAREGILAGGSGGGVVEAVRHMAGTIPPGSSCAVILPDSGTRYLDTVYDDGWVSAELGLPEETIDRLVRSEDLLRSDGPGRGVEGAP